MTHRVCLHGICKDESAVALRMLASVIPHIHAWCIADTGSTDATREIVASTLLQAGKPGRLLNHPWVNFAVNRTRCMEEAREVARENDCDLLLTIDFDEELIAPPGWQWPELEADAYEIRVVPSGSDLTFTRHLVTRAAAPWRYVGAVHEDIDSDRPLTRGGAIPGIHVITRRDGAREKNPDKYLRDAQMLKAEMARNTFYLAQSMRDHWWRTGDEKSIEEALRRYQDRAVMPGWEEETAQAAFEVARCKEALRRPPAEVVEAYLCAHAARPTRAEPLANLSRFLRGIGQPAIAEVFSSFTSKMPVPPDSMYVDRTCYGAPDARIGIITAPRDNGARPLDMTLVSVLSADAVPYSGLRVFSDSAKAPPCSVPVECEREEELQRRQEVGGIYGTLNLSRALLWASGARDVAVSLEDDVLCSRGWLTRGARLLEAAEAVTDGPVVLSLHDMHGREVFGEPAVKVGEDTAHDVNAETFANGSQGYLMRPATAKALGEFLRERMGAASLEERRAWAMDVGVLRWCLEGGARFLYADPCLLLHLDMAPSTWATKDPRWLGDDAAHRALRRTRRFRPW